MGRLGLAVAVAALALAGCAGGDAPCTVGEMRCAGTRIEKCQPAGWDLYYQCPALTDAACVDCGRGQFGCGVAPAACTFVPDPQ